MMRSETAKQKLQAIAAVAIAMAEDWHRGEFISVSKREYLQKKIARFSVEVLDQPTAWDLSVHYGAKEQDDHIHEFPMILIWDGTQGSLLLETESFVGLILKLEAIAEFAHGARPAENPKPIYPGGVLRRKPIDHASAWCDSKRDTGFSLEFSAGGEQ